MPQAREERAMGGIEPKVRINRTAWHEQHDQTAKSTTGCRNGKTGKELRTDHGPMELSVPIREWAAAINQFAIIYGENRVPL